MTTTYEIREENGAWIAIDQRNKNVFATSDTPVKALQALISGEKKSLKTEKSAAYWAEKDRIARNRLLDLKEYLNGKSIRELAAEQGVGYSSIDERIQRAARKVLWETGKGRHIYRLGDIAVNKADILESLENVLAGEVKSMQNRTK